MAPNGNPFNEWERLGVKVVDIYHYYYCGWSFLTLLKKFKSKILLCYVPFSHRVVNCVSFLSHIESETIRFTIKDLIYVSMTLPWVLWSHKPLLLRHTAERTGQRHLSQNKGYISTGVTTCKDHQFSHSGYSCLSITSSYRNSVMSGLYL